MREWKGLTETDVARNLRILLVLIFLFAGALAFWRPDNNLDVKLTYRTVQETIETCTQGRVHDSDACDRKIHEYLGIDALRRTQAHLRQRLGDELHSVPPPYATLAIFNYVDSRIGPRNLALRSRLKGELLQAEKSYLEADEHFLQGERRGDLRSTSWRAYLACKGRSNYRQRPLFVMRKFHHVGRQLDEMNRAKGIGKADRPTEAIYRYHLDRCQNIDTVCLSMTALQSLIPRCDLQDGTAQEILVCAADLAPWLPLKLRHVIHFLPGGPPRLSPMACLTPDTASDLQLAAVQ